MKDKKLEDRFEVRDITYDSIVSHYVFRIYDKETDKINKVTLTPDLEKKQESRHMSFCSDESKYGYTEILELNDLNDLGGISLKAVYKDKGFDENWSTTRPIKIFIKNNNESKWKTLDEPSKEISKKLNDQRWNLKDRAKRITYGETAIDVYSNFKRPKDPLLRGR